MMKQINKMYILLIILLMITAASADGQELETVVPDKEFPEEYIKVTHDRAYDFVSEMELSDDKIERVTNIVARQYRDLSAIQDTRDAQIKMIEKEFKNKETANQLIREIRINANRQVHALHRQFVAKLTAEIPAEQVNEVKNGMTYNVVNVTYNGYLKQLPDLTEKQKIKIKAWLIEAREHAMDAGSSEQKHHIFGEYKGRINNYLSAEGHELE